MLVVAGVVAWYLHNKRKCKKRDTKGECYYSHFSTADVTNPGRAKSAFCYFEAAVPGN